MPYFNYKMTARVSSKEQAAGYSIEAQKKPILEYCRKRGIEVVRVFEFWESAGKKTRTHFNEAIEFVVKNGVHIIAVEKTDRLYRNFRDYVLIEDLIEKHGAAVHFVKENEVFDRDSNSHSKVIHGFKVLMAKAYLDNLSEEIKKGLHQKAREGHFPHRAPFGYRTNPRTRRMEPDPETAPVVASLFEMYATGSRSLDRLVAYLNDHNIRTDNGAVFHPSAVHRILTNPVYYGDFRFKGEIRPGRHQPLVSYELWKECGEIMRRHDLGGKKKRYALSGLLYNEYGRLYSGERHKGHTYYSARRPGTAKKMYIREDAVLGAMDGIIENIRWSGIFADHVRELAREIAAEEKAYLKAAVADLHKEQKRLLARKEKLLNLYLDEGLDRPAFLAKKLELEKALEEIEDKLARHRKGDAEFEKKIAEIIDVFTNLPREYASKKAPASKAALLRRITTRIIADEHKGIKPEFRAPYNLFMGPDPETAPHYKPRVRDAEDGEASPSATGAKDQSAGVVRSSPTRAKRGARLKKRRAAEWRRAALRRRMRGRLRRSRRRPVKEQRASETADRAKQGRRVGK